MFRRLREALSRTGRALAGRLKAAVLGKRITPETLDEVEEILITSDLGPETAEELMEGLRAANRSGELLDGAAAIPFLRARMAALLDGDGADLARAPSGTTVILVCGVNGSGKTTSIAKLAGLLLGEGKSVMLGAGDTFRAAAVEQLQIWGDRAGVPVMTAPQGSDPASLAFEAMTRAEADGADILLIDTAGRLQNRADLMEELAKIVRVIRKRDPQAPHNTVLVLDATTGQNAISQVEIFQKIADVSGLVMTKLDGTAKGGILVALADRFALPIHAIGVGEKIDDLAPFDPADFARALTGAGE